MRRLLPPEGRRPFAHEKPRLVDADLVGERRLKRPLPVVLKRRRPVLVPQPALPIQRKPSAKNSPISSMRWSLSPSTMPSITARVSSVLDMSVSRLSTACSGRAPVIGSALDRPRRQAADDLALEEQDQHEQRRVAETTAATANITLPSSCVVPRKLGDRRDHRLVFRAQQHRGHGKSL
jgi:hypothetical protein